MARAFISPYVEGEEAFRAGKDETDNPYTAGTDEALDWADGWDDARCEAGQ